MLSKTNILLTVTTQFNSEHMLVVYGINGWLIDGSDTYSFILVPNGVLQALLTTICFICMLS